MQSLRILHLEDGVADADLIHRAVAELVERPVWLQAETAGEFLHAVEHEPFDAVFSDGRIPGIEGIEALKLVRTRKPGVPFVFVSGNADPHWAEHCIEAGATDYVLKDELWRLPAALKRMADARDAHRLAWLTDARASLVDVVKRLSAARSVDAIVEIVRSNARRLIRCDGARSCCATATCATTSTKTRSARSGRAAGSRNRPASAAGRC